MMSDKFLGMTGVQLEHVLTFLICSVVICAALKHLSHCFTAWLSVKKEIRLKTPQIDSIRVKTAPEDSKPPKTNENKIFQGGFTADSGVPDDFGADSSETLTN